MFNKSIKEIDMINRHLHIFNIVQQNEPIQVDEITKISDYQKHKVTYSLRILEKNNFVKTTSQGIKTSQNMESKIQNHNDKVSDLIDNINDSRF